MKISELQNFLAGVRKGHGDIEISFSRADSDFGCCVNCDFEVEVDEDKLYLTVI